MAIINHRSMCYNYYHYQMNIISLLIIIIIINQLISIQSIQINDNENNDEKNGPEFLVIPPNKVKFMNDTGTIITCSARGKPPPKIQWIYSSSSSSLLSTSSSFLKFNSSSSATTTAIPLIPIDGLQQIQQDTLSSSQLIYLPFNSNKYRQDVHSIRIRCMASNQFGSIQTPDIDIIASIKQSYEIQVYDDFVIKGNVGILRCHIPTFVRENVVVINWFRYHNKNNGANNINNANNNEKDGSDQLIISDLIKGGRYSIMSNGDLHVHNYNHNNIIDNNNFDLDNNNNDNNNDNRYLTTTTTTTTNTNTLKFRCQTKHLLNGELKQSANYGRLIITDAQTRISPKILTTATNNNNYYYYNDNNNNFNHFNMNNNNKQKIIGNIGDKIELSCLVQANPWPTFTWYYRSYNDNQLILITTKMMITRMIDDRKSLLNKYIQIDNSLFIQNLSLYDNGYYVCIANNSLGQERIEIELIVKAPMNVKLIPSYIKAIDGDTIQFNCSIKLNNINNAILNNYPSELISSIKWYHDTRPLFSMINIASKERDSRIRFLENDQILQIKNVNRYDRGMFQCIVDNKFESIQASGELSLIDDPPTFISVFNIPEPLNTGKSLSIKCSAIGTPLPQIIWTLDGQPLIEHGRIRIGDYVSGDNIVNSFVNISSLRTEDGGIYSCTASNDIHSINHSSRIDVYGPASVRTMKNFTVIAGNTLQIHCPASGYPLQSIEWYKKSPDSASDDDQSSMNRLPQNHRQKSYPNGTLVIENIERGTDDGRYRCMVTSDTNIAMADTFIRVLVAPVISPFHAPPNLREGMRVMLTCTVIEGDPPLLIQFLKDGIPLSVIIKQQQIKSALNNNNNQQPHLKFDRTNDYTATLFIESVTNDDTGNYSCIASNMASITTYSIYMKVNVPPKWIIIPKDTEAIVGQNLAIDCSATGDSRIWWERSIESNSKLSQQTKQKSVNKFRTIVSNSHIHIGENGSLIIRDVQSEDSGTYLCQANNGVGSGLSKVIKLNVHVPAYFRNKFSTQTSKYGETIEFECEVFGEIPIEIQISKDRMLLDFIHSNIDKNIQHLSIDNRYTLRKVEQNDRLKFIVKIEQIDRRDSSLFTCLASNPYGKDEFNFQLIVQEPPEIPENLHAIEIDSRSALITWTQPYSGNSPIIAYHIEYRLWSDQSIPWFGIYSNSNNNNSHSFIDNNNDIFLKNSLTNENIYRKTISGSETSITLKSLQPMTTYEIRVQAENQIGFSQFQSIPLKILTKEEAPSGPPLNINVSPISAHILQITFEPPHIQHQNGQILGYYVGYKAMDFDEHFMFKKIIENHNNVSNQLSAKKEIKITDLRRGTKYLIIVQAFNRIGPGPQSEEIIGETLINDPPKAPILNVKNIDYNSIELNWTIENNSDSNSLLSSSSSSLTTTSKSTIKKSINEFVPEINGYYLYSKSPKGEWEEMHLNSNENSYKYTDLLCGNQYQFYVIAYNNIGKGDPSQAISVRTKGSVPIAPKQIELFMKINSTNALINLEKWQTNGCEIKYFQLKYRKKIDKNWLVISSKIQTSSTSTTTNDQSNRKIIELIDLLPATWYILNIAAITDIGTTEETYSFSTLTIDGATLPPDVMLIQPSSGYPKTLQSLSSSSISSTMIINNQMTILIPAICSVIVLTVITLVACFVIKLRQRQQNFESSLRDGSSNNNNGCIAANDHSNFAPIMPCIKQDATTTAAAINSLNYHQQQPQRYAHTINPNHQNCQLCNNNNTTINNFTKENIEMIDNNNNNNNKESQQNYSTLQFNLSPQQSQQNTRKIANIKASKLRSIRSSTIGNGSNNQQRPLNPNQNQNNPMKFNISPMIWLMVSCCKLNF